MLRVMDIAQAVLTAGFGVIFGLFVSAASYLLLRNRLKEQITGSINIYVAGLLADVEQNPGKYANLLKPVAESLIGQAFPGGKARNVKLGPFSLPAEIVGPLLQRFLGGTAKNAAEEATKAVFAP